ncbi:Kynurenine formamidase [Lamellibrachia satsuma]|nr:Kynurenine formamidase [Lamellibrachia satsuma]
MDMENQYSPSKWSPKGNSEEVIRHHINSMTAGSRLAHSTLQHEVFVYGDTDRQKFELFTSVTLPTDVPLFVYIHGGFWQVQQLRCEVTSFMAPALVGAGNAVVAVGYDLAPQAKMEQILSQLKSCVKAILYLAKKRDSRAVYLCGHSAGAQLAAMMLTVDWAEVDPAFQHLIKSAILVSGIYDLRPLIDTSVNEPLGMSRDSAWASSPASHVTELCERCNDMEVLVVVSQHDSPEFHQQSQQFEQALRSGGVPSRLIEIPDVDHFEVVDNLQYPSYTLTQEIISQMAQSSTGSRWHHNKTTE